MKLVARTALSNPMSPCARRDLSLVPCERFIRLYPWLAGRIQSLVQARSPRDAPSLVRNGPADRADRGSIIWQCGASPEECGVYPGLARVPKPTVSAPNQNRDRILTNAINRVKMVDRPPSTQRDFWIAYPRTDCDLSSILPCVFIQAKNRRIHKTDFRLLARNPDILCDDRGTAHVAFIGAPIGPSGIHMGL